MSSSEQHVASADHSVTRDSALSQPVSPRQVPPRSPTSGKRRGDSGTFSSGQLLAGRFQIVRWIASGGMGDVYEARDLELGEYVAVKTIRQEIANDQQAMDRFRREISLARKVTHPGVCRIFDVFFHTADQTPTASSTAEGTIAFLTMELLEGTTLSEHLRETGPMSTAEARPLICQMAAALASAHEAGVVHRDFKSSNVLIVGGSRGVRTVVTDFGLARPSELGDADGQVTVTGEIIGSPAYMAPEQATGGEITPAADIYSLGVVIYQMVTGRLPFEGPSPFATLIQRAKHDPPPPSSFVDNLDPRWEAAILKCLAREPMKRFATAEDVLTELDPTIRKRHLSRRLSRRLRWAEAILALVLVIAGVAHLGLFQRSPEPETAGLVADANSRRSVAVLGFKNLSGQPGTAWLSTALTELLASEIAIAEGVRTIPGENVARMKIELAVTETDGLAADTLRRIGDHLNAEAIVLGSYLATATGSDSRLRLDARIQDTSTGETIATLSKTAAESDLLELISGLGSELRRELGLEELTIDQQAAKRASLPASPKAARLYAQGLAALRAFDALVARDLLQQAVVADPDYALAHAALAEAWLTLGYDAEAMDQITIAFERSATLPHQERLLVEGQYRQQTQDWDRAIEICRTLSDLYPDSLEYSLDLVRAQVLGNRPQGADASLATLRRMTPPASDDPRIDLEEAKLAWSLAQFPRMLKASTRATEKGRRLGARLLGARARWLEGRALWRLSRLDEALAAAREAETELFALGDRAGAARALNLHGVVLYERGELAAALDVYDRALATFRAIGHRRGIDDVLNNQAIVLQVQGDLDGAVALYQETLVMAREAGDKTNITIGLYNLALVRQMQGQTVAARRMHEEALAIAREIENPYLMATRLIGIAGLVGEEGDLMTARRNYTEALGIMRQLDSQDGVAYTLHQLGQLDLIAGDLASARRQFQEVLALHLELGAEGRALETRVSLAYLTLEEGKVEKAVTLARETADAFADSGRLNGEGDARVTLAKAALAAGWLLDARTAVDQALVLSRSVETVSLKVDAAIIAARVLAAEGHPDKALQELEATLVKATRISRFDQQLEARLAAGEVEIQAGRTHAGRTRLAAVARDASAQGFHLLARKARELSS